MRYLLDTNVLIWALSATERLDAATRALLQSPDNEVAFSAVSIWEIAIKTRLGRTDFQIRPEVAIREAQDIGFTELPLVALVACRVADLPLHHGDPFDRLLIAQAMAGPMHFLTTDQVLQQYSELVTLVG